MNRSRILVGTFLAGVLAFVTVWTRSREEQFIPKIAVHQPELQVEAGYERSPLPALPEQRKEVADAAPETTAEVSGAGILIEVWDKQLSPIAGAEVHADGENAPVFCGVTGETGRLVVAEDIRQKEVRVKAPGYAIARRLLREELPSKLRFVLEQEGRIHGRLLFPSGKSAGPGVQVLVWRRDGSSDWGAGMNALLKSSSITNHLLTTTDDDGAFEFSGLRQEEHYSIAAGGKGCVTPKSIRLDPLSADGTPIEVIVHGLYGVALRLEEPSGYPLHLSSQMDEGFKELFLDKGGDVVNSSYAMSSRQIGVQLAIQHLDALDRTFLFTQEDQSLDVLGPLTYTATFPGHLPVSTELWCPLAYDKLEAFPIVVVPSQKNWGELHLRLSAPLPGIANHTPVGRSEKMGVLELVPSARTAGAQRMTFKLSSLFVDGEQTIDAIPFGEYDSRVIFQDGVFINGESAVTISDTQSEYVVQTDGLGSILINVQHGDGLLYGKSIYLVLNEGEVFRHPKTGRIALEFRSTIQFTSPPYLLPGVRPGMYTVVLMSPQPSPDSSYGLMETHVVEGAVADVVFQLDD